MNKLLAGVFLTAALATGSVYTIDAREVAVVTLFGAQVVRNVVDPGLYIRAPWPIHQVQRFDRRAHLLGVEPAEVLTKDKKNLVVEPFVVWRVADPGRFLETVGSPMVAEIQLSDMVSSRIAAGLGQREFSELISTKAAGSPLLPDGLLSELNSTAGQRLGIEVLEVDLRQVGLHLQNEQSIYERMRAERERIARAYRSEGEEAATRIRAEADRQAAEIRAGADKEAAGIRARAEGSAAFLYARAFSEDPTFYRFVRRLEAMEALVDEDTVLVVDASAPVLRPLSEDLR